VLWLALTTAHGEPQVARAALRVCADPNNLPFSNQQEVGFENALAHFVARDLGRTVTYTWWPQRRGFIRNSLRAGRCDVVMGIPATFELAQPTRPYYRSTYVFVTRRDRGLDIRSLDDPILKQLRIGFHVIGDDYANVPPAQALANRGIVENVVGYSIYGNYAQPNPPATLIDAVVHGEIDVAIAWGPLAGSYAKQSPTPLTLVPVVPQRDSPALTFVFDIAMGVRRDDQELRVALDQVIAQRQPEIRRLLEQYGVPLTDGGMP
jgi:quinoprotein dehydrogenase-associated probable ABC transporter substrate-binding protein